MKNILHISLIDVTASKTFQYLLLFTNSPCTEQIYMQFNTIPVLSHLFIRRRMFHVEYMEC